MEQERPFYLSDEVLNTALIGINNKELNVTALPQTLAPAIAAIKAQIQDPCACAWSIAALTFAYEQALIDCPVSTFSQEEMARYRAELAAYSKDGANALGAKTDALLEKAADGALEEADGALAAADSLLIRMKLHQGPIPLSPCAPEPDNQRYLSAELSALLTDKSTNAIEWMALLARIKGYGLKVPQDKMLPFLQTYLNLRSSLLQRYQGLPLEFLSNKAQYLLTFMSSKDSSDSKEASEDDALNLSELKPHSELWLNQVKQLWLRGSSVERHAALAALLQHHDLESLLSLLTNDFHTLAAKERAEVLEVITNSWLEQLSFGYQHNLWAEREEKSWPKRFEAWLLGLIQKDRAKSVKDAAAILLRLLPHSAWEQKMSALAQKVLAQVDPSKKKAYNQVTSQDEVLSELTIFFPELQDELNLVQQNHHNNKRYEFGASYFEAMTFLLPPQLWFELLGLKRSGDEAQDSVLLFSAFANSFPGWRCPNQLIARRSLSYFTSYLVTRLRHELGQVYLDAFLKQSGPKLSAAIIAELLIASSYQERERLSFLLKPGQLGKSQNPSNVNQHITSLSLYQLLSFVQRLCSEPEHLWGLKFSQRLFTLFFQYFGRNQTASSFYFNTFFAPGFSALALSLDLKVKAQALKSCQQSISELQTEISERELRIKHYEDARAREDIALRERLERENTNAQNKVKCLQELLLSFERSEHIFALCQKEQETWEREAH